MFRFRGSFLVHSGAKYDSHVSHGHSWRDLATGCFCYDVFGKSKLHFFGSLLWHSWGCLCHLIVPLLIFDSIKAHPVFVNEMGDTKSQWFSSF